jgi:hypothetical protein
VLEPDCLAWYLLLFKKNIFLKRKIMKSIAFLFSLIVVSSAVAQEKPKVYYVKKNGKYYKVTKVKKKKAKPVATTSNVTTSTKKLDTPSVSDRNIFINLGVVSGTYEDEYSDKVPSSKENQKEENYLGLEAEAGMKFQLSERVNISPSLFLRRVDRTEDLDDVQSSSIEYSGRSFDYGLNANLGYDFYSGDTILRPIVGAGYSYGNLKYEISSRFGETSMSVDYNRLQYGVGFQALFSNGLAPFGKVTLSKINFKSMKQEDSDGTSEQNIESDEIKQDARSFILGLGIWF